MPNSITQMPNLLGRDRELMPNLLGIVGITVTLRIRQKLARE